MQAPLLRVTILGLALTFAFALVGALKGYLPAPWSGMDWTWPHREMAIDAALLGGLLWLVEATLSARGRTLPDASLVGAALITGATMRALGSLLEPSSIFFAVWLAGLLPLAIAAWLFFRSLRSAVPRGTSLVDRERDPLSKGDDACMMQLRIGAMFLLLGMAGQLLLALVSIGTKSSVDLSGWQLAADHLLLVGFGLPTLFALSHLWVPRLSGVPAIAAGAIKGELHSTLLGIVLLTFGFGLHVKALLIIGGLVVFFAAFVFMGVLGANIMKNKSRTQRVTPVFAYIPWVFSGVLWVVAGVLLGLFLNIIGPDHVFASKLPALRAIHAHLLLLGGFTQLVLGFGTRALAKEPVPFSRHKWAFYAINLALAAFLWASLADSTRILAASAALGLLGLAAWFFPLRRSAEPVMG